MEFSRIDGHITLAGERFKFTTLLWEKGKPETGYFTIGLPFLSANSEVLNSAYPLSLLIEDSDFVYESLIGDEVVESALKNFYELGGVITFNTSGVPHDEKISKILEDENIEKILYCIFLINKINKDNIFYMRHIEKSIQFMPSSDVELVMMKLLSKIFNARRVVPYIVKIIPVSRDVIENARNYREVVIWDLYQNYRAIMITDKVALHEGQIDFDTEYYGSYAIYNAGPELYIKPDLKEKATGFALALVMRKMGNSAFIYRPKINTQAKFRTLVFLVASRLLTLNQIYCLHGDLHAGNFVLELNSALRYSNYIQCEDLFIYNNIDLYMSFDLIDFGSCIEMHEGDAVREYIARIVPNIYSNNKSTIDIIAKASPLDLAISATLLDLYYFIESFYNASTEYEQIRQLKAEFQDYIVAKFAEYIESNSQELMLGGEEDIFSSENTSANIASSLADDYDRDMFVGGDVNPNFGNRVTHHHLTTRILPIYKFLEEFYREESNSIDKEKIFNVIK
jgi:hypothetical protein